MHDARERSWWIWLEGDAETLCLFREVLGDQTGIRFSERDGRVFLQAAALEGRTSPGEVTNLAERFVATATGILRLFAGAPGAITVKGVTWRDWATDPPKGGSITIGVMRIGAKVDVSKLPERPEDGTTKYAALISRAEKDEWLGEVCSIIASGGGWGNLYKLLELLKRRYVSPETGATSWRMTWRQLSQRHEVSIARLEDLKRTASYHRHAASSPPPPRPWTLPEAESFVKEAVRSAVAEYIEAG